MARTGSQLTRRCSQMASTRVQMTLRRLRVGGAHLQMDCDHSQVTFRRLQIASARLQTMERGCSAGAHAAVVAYTNAERVAAFHWTCRFCPASFDVLVRARRETWHAKAQDLRTHLARRRDSDFQRS